MTIHRALAELKLINARIEKKITNLVPSGLMQKGKKVNGVYDQEEFNKSVQSSYASVLDLIDRKNKIKSAIVIKNSETKIKIGEKEMTIADAINYKSLIEIKVNLVESINKKHNQVVARLVEKNNIINENCQKLIEITFGKDNVQISASDIDGISKPYMEQNECHLVDPLIINDEISKLNNEIMTFKTEVDATLSEINATTLIEF